MKWNSFDLDFSRQTYVMGIINVTPDSFSSDGIYKDIRHVMARAAEMVSEGVDILDIGGESTRPGADSVSVEEELGRVIPVLKELKKMVKVPISIDTGKAEVAEKALDAGASMVNDITALRGDRRMAEVVSKRKVPLVLMHMKGKPRTMQKDPHYENLIAEIKEFLLASIKLAEAGGVSRDMIIIDPGIGFGKTVEHNLEILKRLKEFSLLGCPILIGTSRKSFIGKVLGKEDPADRVMGTAASVALAAANGADIVRVHDVGKMKDVVRLTDAIIRSGNNV